MIVGWVLLFILWAVIIVMIVGALWALLGSTGRPHGS